MEVRSISSPTKELSPSNFFGMCGSVIQQYASLNGGQRRPTVALAHLLAVSYIVAQEVSGSPEVHASIRHTLQIDAVDRPDILFRKSVAVQHGSPGCSVEEILPSHSVLFAHDQRSQKLHIRCNRKHSAVETAFSGRSAILQMQLYFPFFSNLMFMFAQTKHQHPAPP